MTPTVAVKVYFRCLMSWLAFSVLCFIDDSLSNGEESSSDFQFPDQPHF